jgi:hypothetical protein
VRRLGVHDLHPGTPVSSTNKNDRHDITEILLTVALNTIHLTYMIYILLLTYFCMVWLTNCIPFPIFDIILEISSSWVPQGFFHLSLPLWIPLHVDAIAHMTGRKNTQIFKCSVQFVCFCVLFICIFFGEDGGGIAGIPLF